MFEILRYFEQIAVRFSPVILISSGLAAVIIGLFLWLGGLGFRRALVIVLGAVTGGICGFFIVGRNILATAVLAVVAAVIVTIGEKIFITILAASLAVVLAFFAFTALSPEVINAIKGVPINAPKTAGQSATISVRETPKVLEAFVGDFISRAKQAAINMPIYGWAVMGVLAALMLAAGCYQQRVTFALCCSVLGTTLIFAGMILLLLYKDSRPVTIIDRNSSFYVAIIGVMLAFGTIEQLLLCPRLERTRIRRKGLRKDYQEPGKKRWRT